jgi:hypothetical protein
MTDVPDDTSGYDLEPNFEISGVRVVATLGHDGGAIVENVRRLQCFEGRLQSFEGTQNGSLHTLEYHFSFSEVDDAEPYAAQAVRGRIVITGNLANGHRLEIRGDGWIGYDDSGRIEGRFDRPPIMIADGLDLDDDEAEGPHEREALLGNFPMPPQFNRANLRVPDRHGLDFDD